MDKRHGPVVRRKEVTLCLVVRIEEMARISYIFQRLFAKTLRHIEGLEIVMKETFFVAHFVNAFASGGEVFQR